MQAKTVTGYGCLGGLVTLNTVLVWGLVGCTPLVLATGRGWGGVGVGWREVGAAPPCAAHPTPPRSHPAPTGLAEGNHKIDTQVLPQLSTRIPKAYVKHAAALRRGFPDQHRVKRPQTLLFNSFFAYSRGACKYGLKVATPHANKRPVSCFLQLKRKPTQLCIFILA